MKVAAHAIISAWEPTGPPVVRNLPEKLTVLFNVYGYKAKQKALTFECLRGTHFPRLAPHVTTPTLMALARHRDYRTTRRYVQVDGDHLRAAVERLADRGCPPEAALVDSLLGSVTSPEEGA